MAIKTITMPLDRDKILSSSNIQFDDATTYMITPFWDGRSNLPEDYVTKTATTTDGDNDMTLYARSAKVDGNLVLVGGWDDGLIIYRINDDGSITQVYWDDTPGAMNYNYISTIAIDTVTKKGWLGSQNAGHGIQEFDYSDIVTGGSTVTYGQFEPQANFNTTTMGYSSAGGDGMVLVGDWIYYSGQNSGIDRQGRWNPYTNTHELLTVTNLDTEDIYRGGVMYDEVNNRVFATGYYSGQIWCTVNPESATPTTYQIRYEALGLGGSNDNYSHQMLVMKENPNHLMVGGNYGQAAVIDITQPLTGVSREAENVPRGYTPFNMSSYGYNGIAPIFAPNPDYGTDFLFIHPRGYFRKGGWFDIEEGNWVGSPKLARLHESKDYLDFNYCLIPLQVLTTNGTKYWFLSGYDYDGRYIYIHSDEQGKIKLASTSNIEFGNMQFDDTSNITSVLFNVGDLEHTPVNTNIYYTASNNNGNTWEALTKDAIHFFSSVGNDLRLKINFSNPGNKASYILSKCTTITKSNGLSVTLFGGSNVETYKNIQIARKRGLRRRRG